jgi:hypothetical protein
MAGADIKPLHAIDHFQGSEEHRLNGPIDTYSEFLRNINNTKARYKIDPELHIWRMNSLEASKHIGFVGMIFIDGSHDYENAKLDYNLWYPKLITGGIIAFHDSYRFGPAKVIREAGQTGHKNPLHVCDSVSWWFKW